MGQSWLLCIMIYPKLLTSHWSSQHVPFRDYVGIFSLPQISAVDKMFILIFLTLFYQNIFSFKRSNNSVVEYPFGSIWWKFHVNSIIIFTKDWRYLWLPLYCIAKWEQWHILKCLTKTQFIKSDSKHFSLLLSLKFFCSKLFFVWKLKMISKKLRNSEHNILRGWVAEV